MVIPLHNNGLSRWSIWVFQVADQRYWSTTRIDTQNVVSFTDSHRTVARSHSTAAGDMAGVYLKMHNVLIEIICARTHATFMVYKQVNILSAYCICTKCTPSFLWPLRSVKKMLSYLEKSTCKSAAHKKKVARSRCRDKKAATQDITQRELPAVDHVRCTSRADACDSARLVLTATVGLSAGNGKIQPHTDTTPLHRSPKTATCD